MFLIFGFRTSARHDGVTTAICPACRVPGQLPVFRETTKFSLFFVPLFPVRKRSVLQCLNPTCLARSRLSAEESRRLLANAGH